MATTASWINIALSIERIFAEFLPGVIRFRAGLPTDEGKRRSLVADKAMFFTITQGQIDRFQDTYVSLWLAEAPSDPRLYTPLTNYQGVWLQQTAMMLQTALNRGDDAYAHLFPIYNYEKLIPAPLWSQFLSDGVSSAIDDYLLNTPPKIENTGFVVRAGSGRPTLMLDRSPMVFEWTVVFQHCNHETWCGQRG